MFFVCVCLCLWWGNYSSSVRTRVCACDDAVILPLCAFVCWCLSGFVSVSLCGCIAESSQAWTSVWQESTALVHYSPNYHSSILWKVLRIWTYLHLGLVCLVQHYVIYLQLSNTVAEVTLSSSISVTRHVISNFQEKTGWGWILTYQLVFSQQNLQIKGRKWTKGER